MLHLLVFNVRQSQSTSINGHNRRQTDRQQTHWWAPTPESRYDGREWRCHECCRIRSAPTSTARPATPSTQPMQSRDLWRHT